MLRFFLGTPKFSLIFFLSSFLGCLGSSTVYSAENPDSRPKLKILVLGPFESAMANYKNTGDEMRSKTVGIFMSHTSGKFQFISGNLALAPLRKLPEAKGIDFTYYDHYHLLTENNFRLARKFGKVHGANFVVVMARDGLKGKHGGKAYLSFVDVDVEDEQHSYSGSRLRGRGDAPVFTLFKKFLLLSRKGIEQALARKQSPGKGVQKSTRQNVEKKGSVGVTVQKSGEQNQNVAFELAFWDAIKYSKSSGDYRAYLEKYPNGQFASLAIFRLNKYSKVANPPTKTSPTKTKLPNLYDRLGRYHALVIGNNKYRNISKLKTAVNDARAVAQVLEQDYGFQVKLLIDATR